MKRFQSFKPGYDPNFMLRPFKAFDLGWVENAKCGTTYYKLCIADHYGHINLEKIIDLSLKENVETLIRNQIDSFQGVYHHCGIDWKKEFDPYSEKKLDKIVCVGRDPLSRFLSCFLMHAYRVVRVPITYENKEQKNKIINSLSFETFLKYYKDGFPDEYPQWFPESVYGHLYFISDNNLKAIKERIVYLDISDIDNFLLSLGVEKITLDKAKTLMKNSNHHRTSIKKEYKDSFYCGDFFIKDLLVGDDLITKSKDYFYNKETKKVVESIFKEDIEFISGFKR